MNNLFNQKILAKKAEEEVDLSKHNFSERRKVLNKWINNLENGVLDKSKEEEFQGEFLYDIFTTVLRAVNKSDGKNEWNLERETKTKLDGQKADGVLGFFDADGKKDVRAVIELKGAKVSLDVRQKRTGDTRTPVEQAFNYAPKYGKNCQWVIVSNYKEIRLYRSNDMTEYQVFFLEKLKDDLEFKKFIYILSFYALVGTEKKKAKTIELSEEYQKNQAEIEKKFYNEYKNIRLHIFENMRKNNPAVNENTIIEKVQKLLDRFLFICFCEDKGLLPNEIFYKTLEKGKNFGDVFEVFKMLCNWINLGNPRENISHFNGGLFKNDDVLESLYVDNEVFEEMKKISEYDFDSELNENILGHIFEQSISDIEDLKKELNGEEFDKKKGKRKKDGIFYTPKYITKYIVENSIKNWLDDKRKELGEDKLPELSEADFEIKYSSKKSDERIYSKNYKKHIEFWTKYREAVKNIKIVDPACGSGAFLITAFEYLLNYNNYLNDKIFDLTGTKDLFSDTTREILQNNIFGVDLNKESVEITKLSLWLKTANKNKTLATLENNIKCGNSLIDDIEIAGELAFDWEKEFPQVFKNGGFDVVVGNPPYFNVQTFGAKSPIVSYLMDKYSEIWQDKSDILFYFIYKALKISKGEVGFIISNAFLFSDKAQKLRNYIVEKGRLEKIINFEKYMIFEEASITSCIVMFGKENRKVKGINLKEKNYSNDEILKYLNGNKEYEIELKKMMYLQ
ncbi:Eco57I restriction endonuclease [Leptotrichia trevisanii]|uniref:site-specific DNA-methyltransferase (adenine-specific) n=1 Tax=Leptotrichia trevisanii TaxID=109328 RepID=A0A510KPN8_9FUSO|nr:N-6 DNA methylase [Leptotrichia trevisanii]BBM53699.1 Eco57I restriction endonuclease [Leptotrichia trevisanii]